MPAAVAAGCSQVVVISNGEDFSPAVEPTLLGHCMEGFWGFVFFMEPVLITLGWFPHPWAMHTQGQGLFCSSSCPTSEEAGGTQGSGRGHSWNS